VTCNGNSVSGYAQIYQLILDSSIWQEPGSTRLVWITMLVLADGQGVVRCSVPGLARRANVGLEECRAALETLTSPDPDDQSGVDEGRRLHKLERGWLVVNHEYYRNYRTQEQMDGAERVRRYRERQAAVTRNNVTPCNGTKRGTASASAVASGSDPEGSAEGSPRPKRWRIVPADWEPNEKHLRLAEKLGLNPSLECAAFRDHEFRDPKSDADKAFSNWLRRGATFQRPNGKPPGLVEHEQTKPPAHNTFRPARDPGKVSAVPAELLAKIGART
jgi:hypothetical protein